MPPPDGLLLLASSLGIGALVAGAGLLRRRGWAASATRRLVHVGVCLFVALAPWLFSEPGPLYGLALGFVAVNAAAKTRGWWPGVHAAKSTSWGTVALPLAVVPALAATWSVAPDRRLLFAAAFLVVGFADPAAAWIGERRGGPPLTEAATLWGSTAFAGCAGLLLSGLLLWGGWPAARALPAAAIAAGVATTVEAISRRGWDNLTVAVAVLAVLVPLQGPVATASTLGLALLGGAAFGGAAWRVGALNGPGAAAAALFAATLVGLGGTTWVLPGLAFFVPSSALSVLPDAGQSEGPAPPRRTLRQVMANGAGAWALLLTAGVAPGAAPTLRAACYAGFVGALAAAAADTWATEIGIRYGGAPRALWSGRPVAPGTSGAVTLAGTAAGTVGAAVVAAAPLLADPAGLSVPSVAHGAGAGLVGMGLDSLAGATIQAQYRMAGGEVYTEHPPTPGPDPVRGWAVVDNEAVNLLGTLGGAAASVVLWTL
jgi:uncharacterized protein (TIGR00297 family)